MNPWTSGARNLAKIKSPISNNHVFNHFDMAFIGSCKYKLEESDALSQVGA
jgi:hypothetical protein